MNDLSWPTQFSTIFLFLPALLHVKYNVDFQLRNCKEISSLYVHVSAAHLHECIAYFEISVDRNPANGNWKKRMENVKVYNIKNT